MSVLAGSPLMTLASGHVFLDSASPWPVGTDERLIQPRLSSEPAVGAENVSPSPSRLAWTAVTGVEPAPATHR